MVASVSSTPNPRFTSQNPKRPPLLPSEPPNATSAAAAAPPRKPKSREVTSRYLSSTPSSSRRSPSPVGSRTAPNTPANTAASTANWSRSADRRRPGTPEMSAAARLLTAGGNGGSKRSLSVSFQGEGFAVPTGMKKSASTPAAAERRRNVAADENSRPAAAEQRQRWPGSCGRSWECGTPGEKKMMNGGSGGHVARALQMQHSMDESTLSSVSGSTTASDQTISDPEIVSSKRPRAIAVPARFWQETTNRLKRLPEQNSTKKSFNDNNLISSPPKLPGSALSPRGKLSPSRVRIGGGMSDSVNHTPSVLGFGADARRGKVGENKLNDMHELRILHNRQLQWRFANAKAAAAIQKQKDTAEKTIYNAWENTSRLRDSVESKRVELQQLRQQLKLYSILKGQLSKLEDWELLEGDYSTSLAGAVESLVASTLRLPLVGGAKANIQELENTISSAVDVMQGIGFSLCGLLDKAVQTNSLASELASMSSDELASLDQCRDLFSTLTALQVEDCCLRTQKLQLTRIISNKDTNPDSL